MHGRKFSNKFRKGLWNMLDCFPTYGISTATISFSFLFAGCV